jgi:hypothetical protein
MSFISVEPQSRVFLESHSNGLLKKFDIQLEIIADRYLTFFKERSVIVIWVLCIPLSLRLSGEELRHPSQLSFENSSYLVSGLISHSRSIDSLRKLHQHANVVDSSFDPRSEPTTTRAAWDEMRDSLERGTQLQFYSAHRGPSPSRRQHPAGFCRHFG